MAVLSTSKLDMALLSASIVLFVNEVAVSLAKFSAVVMTTLAVP